MLYGFQDRTTASAEQEVQPVREFGNAVVYFYHQFGKVLRDYRDYVTETVANL